MQQIKRRGDGQPFRGIICEDKKAEAMKMRQILESRGYEILAVAENGRELMNLLNGEHKGKVDFVLLDIIMPVLDGYAAFTEIRDAGIPVRVLFVTVENSRAVMRGAGSGLLSTDSTAAGPPLSEFSAIRRRSAVMVAHCMMTWPPLSKTRPTHS